MLGYFFNHAAWLSLVKAKRNAVPTTQYKHLIYSKAAASRYPTQDIVSHHYHTKEQ